MKKTIILIFGALLLTINPICGQTMDDYLEIVREVFKSEKKLIVADAMMLSDAESVPFWELYNEYNSELYKVHTKRVNIIKDFAANYDLLTNDKADQLWNDSMAYQSELLKLNKTYYKKFKKILPASKAALYFQIENKIETLVSAELAQGIPLVATY